MQDKKYFEHRSWKAKLRSWIDPFSFLKNSLLNAKELDELHKEYYRKAMVGILIKFTFFFMQWYHD